MTIARDCARICRLIDYHADSSVDLETVRLLVAAEDRRFYTHCGVDLRSVFRAILQRIRRSAFSGASTIEMQLVRTVTDKRELTLRRKMREALVAICVAHNRSKLDVAGTYLAVAYLGKDVIGLAAASQVLFRRRLDQCTTLKKAVLVAAIKRPIPEQRTLDWYKRVFRRARRILIMSNTTY